MQLHLSPKPDRRASLLNYFDIFADAGEYTGVDLGDESDESAEDRPGRSGIKREGGEEGEVDEAPPPRKWLATSDDEREPSRGLSQPPPPGGSRSPRSASRSMSPRRRAESVHKSPVAEEGEMEEEERPIRLQPLASSAVPSIKELIAMSEEAEKAEKRRARKEKKKAGGEGGAGSERDLKAKVDRDYQRLKAYTEKKNKS
ncbi:hypothetical protein NUW54_g9990 [Trametes sanguinea]|uniref:Uncharacterized protein n=1 Tax=Trametes sanguinea TaxID=158606 RepID=A0ACC1P5A0_9APHY|nr:hypothetical protein NUW54_g9990 [Trametes sanguinea]